MDINDLNIALSFLGLDDYEHIGLQVKEQRDIEECKDYIERIAGTPILNGKDFMLYYGKFIKFIIIGNETNIEQGKLFYIERVE